MSANIAILSIWTLISRMSHNVPNASFSTNRTSILKFDEISIFKWIYLGKSFSIACAHDIPIDGAKLKPSLRAIQKAKDIASS